MAKNTESQITQDQNSPESELSEKERKKIERQKKDKEYKDNEIKLGLRSKLIMIFSFISLAIAIGIMIPAIRNQTKSLLEEKKKQGKVITRGLTSALKSKLIDIYGQHQKRMNKFKTSEEFRKFYSHGDISIAELIFEDIDDVNQQPDVEYAYILGKHNLVLGHTNQKVRAYNKYDFEEGVKSYFEKYKEENYEKPIPISTNIKIKKLKKKNSSDNAESEDDFIEVIDFASILAFKNDPEISDGIGEVHIGISLEKVNEQIFNNKVELQLVGVIAIAFGILAALIFSALISNPIRKIISGMRQVTQGNFSANVILHSKDEVGLLSRTFNVMLKGMSVLVSPEVAQVVLSGGDLLTSGQRKVVTVLFSDIRAFTTISEALTPHEVVDMLNNYMEIMTDVIIKYGGVVDKFVGDEIFAVFGAPFDHPIHPLCATATALEMEVELDKHNEDRKQEGKPPILIGIGVNTGDVIAGAMGSSKRIDYTSIGDAVNLGARLEGTNKIYGTRAILSEFTYEIIKDDIISRELDLIRVKGKNKPVTIYEALALTETGKQKVNQYLKEHPRKHH